MKGNRSLAVHIGLLVVASALALGALTKEDDASRERHEVELWKASVDAVQRIEYEADQRKVILASQKDEHGQYFVGTVEREKRVPPKNPHQQQPTGDAGAPPPEPEAKPERETIRFVGADEALELAESLATLRAKRSLGKLEEARFEEFGFTAEDEARLRISLEGKTRELVIGGKTPGGGDVYVRNPESGEAYVVPGTLARDLAAADARVIARDLTTFEETDVTRAVVSSGETRRELVPVEDQKGFWANPSDPAAKDETASNWMTKVDRLRISEFVEKPEQAPEPVAKIEFFSEKGETLGVVELAQLPPEEGEERPRYLARSDVTRWYGKVLSTVGEQLSQDLASVLNP